MKVFFFPSSQLCLHPYLIFLQNDVKSAEPMINIHVRFFFYHNFEIVTVIERDSAWLGSGTHPAAWIQTVRLWQTNSGHGQENIYRTPVSNCLNLVRQHLWLEAFCLQPGTLFP